MGGRGGSCYPPPPSLCLILDPRRKESSENFFMDKYHRDESTAKNLVCKKALPILEESWENLLLVFAIGGLNYGAFWNAE